ncbi:response regulator transcription factor [Cohnella cholangitidis]|uniref:Response regulator transcription factor n=1 Tax=Cohnella cholangitidis TaxID=2598458 RepID=A0A7G5C365_9BACL|nr:response regulator transcription factor [Cohnella cholangitidis]QMV43649.1 response regulator transcription factor [Cohnella cholangitidis]
MRDKIIIIDDDVKLRMHLAQFLTRQGYEVINSSYQDQQAMDLLRFHHPALIALDIPTPCESNFALCIDIRKFSDIPILFMSRHNDDSINISALSSGGDDFISKPFNMDILLARIKALIRRDRRAFPINQRHLLLFPDLEIDLLTQSIRSYGLQVTLSPKEFKLLEILAKSPNRVYPSETLYELIWNDTKLSDIRTVMVHIYTLRQKIEENPRQPRYIHTVRGVGYKFNAKL